MLTFAYPHFLWGLLALAGPVLLHLLNRKQPQRLIFPSIRFLQISPLPREGRRRLRDILLLLCRIALFIVIVLALARPQWRQKNSTTSVLGLRQAIILLDSSASLHWQGAAEKSRQAALAAIEHYSQAGWQVSLATYSRQLLTQLPFSTNTEALHAAVVNWQPTLTAGRPEEALGKSTAMFSPTAEKKRLLIISDFQSSDWTLREVSLPQDIELEFMAIDSLQTANVGITSVLRTPLAGDKQRLLAVCRNYSAESQQRLLSIRLGQQSQSQSLQLEAAQTQRLAFVFDRQDDTTSQGRATLTGDAFPLDDEYYFWAGTDQPVKVLLIMPDEVDQLAENEAFFVSKALSAEKEGVTRQFSWERLGAASLFAADIQSYQMIFLLGSAERLTAASWQKITAFLKAGGVIFHTPGQAPAIGWHAMREYGLCRWHYQGMLGEASNTVTLGLSWVEPDSPLGRIFCPESSDLFLFSIRKHARLQATATEKILLKTLDGLPALLETEYGNGRLYSFAFAFNLSWSDFPLSQAFLPLIRELCYAAIPPQHGRKRITCGEDIPRFYKLDGSEILPDKPIDSSRPAVAIIGDCPLEIILDHREALPETVKTSDLQRFLHRQDTPSEAINANLTSTDTGSRPLWHYCLFIMALLILLEAGLTTKADARKGKGL